MRFASSNPWDLLNYLSQHREASDLLLRGEDPFFARTKYLRNYLEPILNQQFDHISNIRIGTKALTFWPYRFTHDADADADADELLRLLENICL